MQSASASARTALKQSSTEGEAVWDPEAESVPKEGLELWLDASVNVELEDSEEARASADSRGVYSFFAYSGPATSPVGEAVYRWSCRGGTGTVLTADWYAGRGRGSVPSHDVGSPVWRAGNCVADSGPTPSVFFDYGHTATFNRSFGAKTVVSVHSFEQRGRADHMRVHGYAGELCNFYIFTDGHNYPMHTGSAQDPHNLGALGEGSLRLDGCHALPFSQSSCWFDQGPRLAVAQFATEKRPLSRIGADRNCHHFCGSIAEVLVYSRDLKLHEIEALERYLKAKHRSSTIPLLQRLAFSVVLQNPPDADILSTVPEHIRNQIPTAS